MAAIMPRRKPPQTELFQRTVTWQWEQKNEKSRERSWIRLGRIVRPLTNCNMPGNLAWPKAGAWLLVGTPNHNHTSKTQCTGKRPESKNFRYRTSTKTSILGKCYSSHHLFRWELRQIEFHIKVKKLWQRLDNAPSFNISSYQKLVFFVFQRIYCALDFQR